MFVSTQPGHRPNRLHILLLALLLSLIPLTPMAAQEPAPVIRQATLRLWSEYDDPGLLVIFSGEFSDEVTFPLDVAFPLPDGARGIQATVQDPESGLLNRPWEVIDGMLTYSLPMPGFHIEYYVDLPPAGAQRVVSYTFKAPYEIQLLEISIQQPARATDFSVEPEPVASSLGADGLMYYQLTSADMMPGEPLPITIRYTKSDQGLTLAEPAAPAAPSAAPPIQDVGASSSAPGQTGTWLPWLLISLGTAALVGLLTYWFLQQRQPAAATPPTRKATARSRAPSASRGGAGSYCTQCGHKMGPNDRFCAQCGAPRRSA